MFLSCGINLLPITAYSKAVHIFIRLFKHIHKYTLKNLHYIINVNIENEYAKMQRKLNKMK